jgi:hypothetical protein
MKHRSLIIARIHRWIDRQRALYTVIPARGWAMHQINQDYRERHYWQINRGNG